VPNLKLPGARTGFAYLWAIALGPVLLLATGVALLVMGFIRHVDSVAAIGAVAIVASLLLPRMQGAFKIGPGGIEGDLENEFFREVIRQARESGQDAESALELGFDAERALPPPAATSMHLWELVRTTGASRGAVRRWSPIAEALASEVVQESVRLGRDTATIVERVAQEKRWQVKRNVRVQSAAGGSAYRIFDFVITTRKGLIFVDSAIARQPEGLATIVASVGETLRDQENLLVPARLHATPLKDSAKAPL
jgi:hypothetical protein